MSIIKEPQGVDFTVDGRELTSEEQQRISAYIQQKKLLRQRKSIAIQTQRKSSSQKI